MDQKGGRLSPTLWNLVADVPLKEINLSEFLQALADDLASLICGTDISELRNRAQLVLNAIEHWCTEAGLQINTTKSTIVIFTHRHNIALDQPLTYLGSPLPVKTTVKYLGVHLDSKLSWSTHLRNRLLAVNIEQAKIKVTTARHWGLNPATLSWIYKSLSRPKLLYGSIFWANSALQYKSNNCKIQKFGNMAARSVTGTSKFSPLAPTKIIANLEPINLSIQRSALTTYTRISATNPTGNPLQSKGKFTPHSLYASELEHNILGDDTTPIDKLYTPFCNVDRKFIIDTDTSIDLTSFQDLPNCTLIFTDGSQTSEGNTGSG